jgi:hypothetical protein
VKYQHFILVDRYLDLHHLEPKIPKKGYAIGGVYLEALFFFGKVGAPCPDHGFIKVALTCSQLVCI